VPDYSPLREGILPYSLVKFERLILHPVSVTLPGKADLRRQIEQNGEVGSTPSMAKA